MANMLDQRKGLRPGARGKQGACELFDISRYYEPLTDAGRLIGDPRLAVQRHGEGGKLCVVGLSIHHLAEC
jgi:hypothetical protein